MRAVAATTTIIATCAVVSLAYADEPTAAEVATSPPPGAESGRTDRPEGESVARKVGRVVLLPARVLVEIAFTPVRGGVYAYERFQIHDWWTQMFFDDKNQYGLYPVVRADATYGLTLGVRAVHRNVFGKREHVALRVFGGGEFREASQLSLRSGDRFGKRARLHLVGEIEQRPADAYYGIGNNVETVQARHRQQIMLARGVLDIKAASDLHLGLAGAVTELDYGRSSDYPPIDDIYAPMTLTGFSTGMRNAYGEAELRWDSRRLAAFDGHEVYERGWLLSVYGGRVHQLGGVGDDYWRYGSNMQVFVPIGLGPRMLMTRVHVEAVTGDQEDVAFTQLPQLGGQYLLRGYPRERFRDRLALVTTAEYAWDLSRWLEASAFVDVGRVYPSWTELHYERLRVGYGVSVQLHRSRRFVSAVSIASSRDGGVFVDFALDPVFAVEPRVEAR